MWRDAEGEGESYCLVPDGTLCQPLIQMVFLFCDRNDEVSRNGSNKNGKQAMWTKYKKQIEALKRIG